MENGSGMSEDPAGKTKNVVFPTGFFKKQFYVFERKMFDVHRKIEAKLIYTSVVAGQQIYQYKVGLFKMNKMTSLRRGRSDRYKNLVVKRN